MLTHQKQHLKLQVQRSADIQPQVSEELNNLDVETSNTATPMSTSHSELEPTLNVTELSHDIEEAQTEAADKVDFFDDKLIEQALEIFEAKISN